MSWITISLGGSLINPGVPDQKFIRDFSRVILSEVGKGKRFAVVCGGGALARDYQRAGREAGLPDSDLDWLGIYATYHNAHFVKAAFGDKATGVIKNPSIKPAPLKSVVVSAGWKPGWSTDYVAVRMAKTLGSRILFNLSSADAVYNRDPRQYPNAKPFLELAWTDMEKLLAQEWKPGLNAPFDPIAVRAAKKLDIKAKFIGRNMNNFSRALSGKSFFGTLVNAH